jgi:lysophospholipase
MQFSSFFFHFQSIYTYALHSTATFKLDYPPIHVELFLDQTHANTIGGYVPNTNSPDPNFGKCMQCIAIDRARYNVNPPLARSSVCTQCFQQYCFDPNNLTSASALPGRKLDFVDPDPQGVSAVSGFLSKGKLGIIMGFVSLTLLVAGVSGFLCVIFIFFLSLPSALGFDDSDLL